MIGIIKITLYLNLKILIFKAILTNHLFTKKAIISVSNDLATDHRVYKTCLTLSECGYEVLLVGRLLKNSPSLDKFPFPAKRMKLFFTSGPLFYFALNFRLFLILIGTKCDLFFANDLDTVPANFLAAKLKGKKLIYDSHELYCEVPELQKTPLKKKIWEWLEKRTIPYIKIKITVNSSIARFYEKRYKTHFSVVRNIPFIPANIPHRSKKELGLPDKKIIIYQGAGININRGAEELIEAMQFVDNALLIIIGGGDVWSQLKYMAEQKKLNEKIRFIEKLPKTELLQYTMNSDLGISIDKPDNLNYLYSLPNKTFDYIWAEVPILASRLPEIEKLIGHYNIGNFIEHHDPKHIAEKINETLNSPQYPSWKQNLKKAKLENDWENEKLKLRELILSV
jgi:glycosyltransferase involved in cell wall biosynthesis